MGIDFTTLAMAKAMGGGTGGGSSGPADWNTMLNKPFYEETGFVPLLPTQTLTFAPNSVVGGAPAAFVDFWNIAAGQNMLVKWNGTEYPCVSFDTQLSGYAAVAFGNAGLLGGADTGEPFIALSIAAVSLSGLITTASGSFEVSVETEGAIITPLDNKFLNMEWKQETETGLSDVILDNYTTVANGDTHNAAYGFYSAAQYKTVKVIFDDVEYNLPVKRHGTAYCWVEADNFVIGFSYDGINFTRMDTTVSHTVTVIGTEKYEEIPAQFLPHVLPELILQGTNGSYYRLEIIADGSLRTTEVTV